MVVKQKDSIRKEQIRKKLEGMQKDRVAGMSWNDIAIKEGYKSGAVARTMYYRWMALYQKKAARPVVHTVIATLETGEQVQGSLAWIDGQLCLITGEGRCVAVREEDIKKIDWQGRKMR